MPMASIWETAKPGRWAKSAAYDDPGKPFACAKWSRGLDVFLRRAVGVGRVADQVALDQVAAAGLEELALVLGLYALGDHADLQRVRERDDGRDDCALVAVVRQLGDEAAVDLDLVDREAAQVREARVTGAEVVDGDRDSQRFQPFQ